MTREVGDATADEGGRCLLCGHPLARPGLVLVAERFALRPDPKNPDVGLEVVLDARAHAECAIDSNRDGWQIDLSPGGDRAD